MFYAPLRAITTEQEQQFKYYWYAAKQAIVEERYDDAYVLLTFCNALDPKDGSTLTFLGIIEQGIGNELKGLLLLKDGFEADPYDQWFHYSKVLSEMKTPTATTEALRVLEKAYESQKTIEDSRKSKDKSRKTCVDEGLLDRLQDMYLNFGMWQKALDIQDELDKIRGYNAPSAVLRARVSLALNKPKKALAELNRYIEFDPTDVRFYILKLEVMDRLKAKVKDLYPVYEKVVELDPYNLSVLNNYAWTLATHKGDLNKAEKMSAITIREEPDNPVYLDTYGWIMYLKGQNELAKFYLEKASMRCDDGKLKEEIDKHLRKVK